MQRGFHLEVKYGSETLEQQQDQPHQQLEDSIFESQDR
jgi:hypothetical protein